MRLDDVVAELDAYFRVPDVRGDDWSRLAMVEWFRRRGLPAEFRPDGPK